MILSFSFLAAFFFVVAASSTETAASKFSSAALIASASPLATASLDVGVPLGLNKLKLYPVPPPAF